VVTPEDIGQIVDAFQSLDFVQEWKRFLPQVPYVQAILATRAAEAARAGRRSPDDVSERDIESYLARRRAAAARRPQRQPAPRMPAAKAPRRPHALDTMPEQAVEAYLAGRRAYKHYLSRRGDPIPQR
jgi:hypothetical protein